MNHRLTAYALLLLVSVIWGVAGPVIKFTLGYFPPLVFLLYRLGLSSLVTVGIFIIKPAHIRWTIKGVGFIFFHSVFAIVLGLGLLFLGFDKTTSLTGVLITSTGPIMVAIAGALFLHEHITKYERIGIGIALIGTLIVTIAPIVNGAETKLVSLSGNLLIIGSLVVDTVGSVIAKEALRHRIPAWILVNTSFLIGFLILLPLVTATTPLSTLFSTISTAPIQAHFGVWYMALLSGTTAYTLQLIAMRSIELSEVAVFNYLFPIWAAPLALFWLGEKITLPFIIGAAVIATGVVIAEHKRRQKKQKRQSSKRKK